MPGFNGWWMERFTRNPGCTCYREVPVPPMQPWWKTIRYNDFHFNWIWDHHGEKMVLFGVAGGRAPGYEDDEYNYIYSLRFSFHGVCKIELNWTT